MRTDEIRRTFLDFFRERGHQIWPSSSLIPNDPTLLLTVAGMVQFKPYFLGEKTPKVPRAASVQKCARTVDIDNVGHTTRHFTVFEMLGNFSFGDYFKADAIRWAWQLSTQGFGFAPERIWVTVYEDDDEAEQLWLSETEVPPQRIQRVGIPEGETRRDASDNYWSMGGAGPCGPCSELYYDRGPEHGPPGGPAVDENRYLEFWNLVFMQFEQDEHGVILGELPQQNVDTGMGLERMAMLLQGVPNAYETDMLRPLVDRAAELTGVAYGDTEQADVSLRVIAEHARATAFLVGDGVLPSNEARGYVLRRLLRRVVRNGRSLGATRPIMGAMAETVIDTLGDAWPELRAQRELVTRVVESEEAQFTRTLRTGLALLEQAIDEAKDYHGAATDDTAAATESGEGAGDATAPVQLSGATAFTLHDTYGFPIDLTIEIAAEHGVEVDRDAFAAYMEQQRARARAAAQGGAQGVPAEVYRQAASTVGSTRFVGYEHAEADTALGALLDPAGPREVAEEGDEVQVVLPLTPFYPEGGGQLGDHGLIETHTGRLEVVDTFEGLESLTAHRARVAAGEVRPGQEAHAAIDTTRRASITRGHTATHILHATIKELLGPHAQQAGSAIDAGHFRFDFPHFEQVSSEQIAELEAQVNARVGAGPPVETMVTSREEAEAMGAIALFGEKYGERVRVVRIGDFSTELCGGTHVPHTPEVQVFTVINEGSISANTRRLEAVTGPEALDRLTKERLVAEQVARLLNVGTDAVAERVADLMDRLRAAEKELADARQQALLARADDLLATAEREGDHTVLAARVDGADRDGLKTLALDLRNRIHRGVVVLAAPSEDGKAALVAAVTTDLVEAGAHAAEILRPAAAAVGGGAGGKGDVAQAGGKEGGKIDEAVAEARRAAAERLRG